MIRQALGLAVLGGFVATATADCTVTMQGALSVDAPVDFSFAPKAALAPWQMMAVTGGFDANADGSRNFACVADARRIDGRVRVAEPKPGVVTCEWTFEPKSDLKLIVLGLMSDLKIADYGYVLELGKISMHGPAGRLIQDDRLIEAYLGNKK